MAERSITLQCPACRELVPLGAFQAEGGVLTFECAACGASIRRVGRPVAGTLSNVPAPTALPPVQAAPPSAPSSAPPVTPPSAPPSAPSLAQPSPAAAALPVRTAEAAASAPAAPSTAPTPEARAPDGADPTLWNAWVALAGAWDNPRAHDAFVATCSAAQALPFAGVRYREHLAAHPTDAMARRGRDRVLGQAMAMAQSRASVPSAGSAGTSRGKVVMWVAAAVMLAVAASQMVTAMRTLNQVNALPGE